ncbi:unnamed protein product [Mycena citricolor]|uniref:RNA helicase n=1 Tax=Mycena citricolor TaxID=2018698 RepID=A0AAD2HQB0_9AGAR|nr:unnamed protein product [Mycena citricolor]
MFTLLRPACRAPFSPLQRLGVRLRSDTHKPKPRPKNTYHQSHFPASSDYRPEPSYGKRPHFPASERTWSHGKDRRARPPRNGEISDTHGLEGVKDGNASQSTVLAYFTANVDTWCRHLSVQKRLVDFGGEKGDVKSLLQAFSKAAARGVFSSDDAFDQYGLAHIRGTDSLDVDIAFSRVFFAWLETCDVVPNVSPTTMETLKRIHRVASNMHPAEGYTLARRMRRKFIMHVGPTNSGKTHHALRALASAKLGVYAGPLRLLAFEIWERMNLGQIVPLGATAEQIAEAAAFGPSVDNPFARRCNMITGEEHKITSDLAGISSSTVEMLYVNARYDVAVIDEIQMIADRERGSAWTHAVLGLCAKEIYLCGEETAIPVIRKLVEMTGDELEVKHYQRLTPLIAEDHSLDKQLSKVTKGDCIVCFSRSSIFAIKRRVEKETNLKCVVIYGKLPPEIRAQQAALFNDPDSGYDVLIGSDAIGMGLNLKIRRVIFETVHKFEGLNGMRQLSDSQMKQIAGRAGRFGMHNIDEVPRGLVTTLKEEDLPILRRTLPVVIPPLTHVRVDPQTGQYMELMEHMPPDVSIEVMITALVHAGSLPVFMRPSLKADIKLSSELLSGSALSHKEVLTFAQGPFPWRDLNALAAMSRLLMLYRRKHSVEIEELMLHLGFMERLEEVEELMRQDAIPGAPKVQFNAQTQLGTLELCHKFLVLYMWLTYRNEVAFPSAAAATEIKTRVETVLHWALERSTAKHDVKLLPITRPAIGFKPRRNKRGEDPVDHAHHFAATESKAAHA